VQLAAHNTTKKLSAECLGVAVKCYRNWAAACIRRNPYREEYVVGIHIYCAVFMIVVVTVTRLLAT
jgi:hypothetical protein